MQRSPKVVVVGAGIIGLTTARELQDAGYDVEIWARDTLHNTCSSVAAAFWYPYVIQPVEAVQTWGIATLNTLLAMEEDPASGIKKRKINAIFKEKTPDPIWAADIPTFRRMQADEIPQSHTDGFCFESVAIEMPIFLPYIIHAFMQHGGRLVARTVTNFSEPFDHADIVVNCTGLGAKELCLDDRLTPVRGQVVCTRKGNLEEMYSDSVNMIYIVPFGNSCVLGGTAEKGEWDMTPSNADTEDIIQRCAKTLPEVANWEVTDQRVGLRPSRDRVRLEAEEWQPGKVLIHNYGHGGAGVTLSYGCAAEVSELVHKYASTLVAV